MKAIGRIAHCNAVGQISVDIFYDGKWQGSWIMENEMPDNHPDFGLFEFEPADQFCKWIDPSKIDNEIFNLSKV